MELSCDFNYLAFLGTTPSYTEPELVSQLKEKNDQSFNYLYDHYSGALYTVILQIVSNPEQASDVLQEVFINIWRKIDSYDPSRGRLFTWMLNIARNAAIDAVRSKAHQNEKKNLGIPESGHLQSADQPIHFNVDHIGIKKTVGKLKTDLRVLIELAYFKGYTHEEIATIEKIPLGTVKTRIRTALIQLRAFLK